MKKNNYTFKKRQTKQFTTDICSSWSNINANFNNKNKLHENKIIIWHNSEIKIENKTVFFQIWHDKGIKYVEHLFEFRTRSFYTFEDFKFLYNIDQNQFYKYIQLIHSIPRNIKQNLQQMGINSQNNNAKPC